MEIDKEPAAVAPLQPIVMPPAGQRRPLLLDLFCGAGGASMGYYRAGFDLIGVDIKPQPRYPFEFHQADALEYLAAHGHEFDAIHASPPCQAYSALKHLARQGYPQLVEAVRQFCIASGKPYVIENVKGAPLSNALRLCGNQFGLALYRHRYFESPVFFWSPGPCVHAIPASKAGHYKPGTIISVAGNCAPIALARQAMGIDWMNRNELAEAIPPAYTEFLGRQLLAVLTNREAA